MEEGLTVFCLQKLDHLSGRQKKATFDEKKQLEQKLENDLGNIKCSLSSFLVFVCQGDL